MGKRNIWHDLQVVLLLSMVWGCEIKDTSPDLIVWGDSRIAGFPFGLYLPALNCLNKGLNGDEISTLINRFQRYEGKTVLFSVGLVDFMGRQNENDTAILSYFMDKYSALIKLGENYQEIIITGIIPYTMQYAGESQLRKSHLIHLVNDQLRDYCQASVNCKYVDLTEYLLDDHGFLHETYSTDGIHLNNIGNELFGKALRYAINR